MNSKLDIHPPAVGNTPATSAGGYVDFTRFSTLRARAHKDENAAMQQVADEFEAMFAETMLKAAREADHGEGMFSSSELATYHEMMDSQLAQSLARTQDFGFSKMLSQQFAGVLASAKTRPDEGGDALATLKNGTLSSVEAPLRGGVTLLPAVLRESAFKKNVDVPADRQAFIDELAPVAATAASDLGVAPRALMAQAALESGWGKHVIRMPDGSSSHNYFGIKASRGWSGQTVKVPTTEFIGGRAVTVNASFRAYPDAKSAFRDYVDFIGNNPRYQKALEHGANAGQYARQLEAAGYATDPNYANKIMAILAGDGLDGANPNAAQVSN
jgi:flagellar protein FlgJ